MDFNECTRLWDKYYHKAAMREKDVDMVRALYEQRISDLEEELERLSSFSVVVDETLVLSL